MTPLRTPALPPDAQRQLQAELKSGERVVWAGQPRPRLFSGAAVGAVLFGIPWTAFALFWTAGAAWGAAAAGDAGVGFPLFRLFPLFGVPFILIGLWMLSSPYWMRRKLLRTVYAVTDGRAVVIEGAAFARSVTVHSFLPDRLTAMTRTQRTDGSGDLVFEQFRQRAGSGTTTVTRGFLGVERVRDVEALIASTLLAGRVRPVD
jgi:hypothetical protein